MKYMILMVAILAAFITSAREKTLEEVQAEYTDGTKVYSFRYEGKGLDRVRWDTVKKPNGKLTINKKSDPDTDPVPPQPKVDPYEEFLKKGQITSITTNAYGRVRTIICTPAGEYLYYDRWLKDLTNNVPGVVSGKLLKSAKKAKLLKATPNELREEYKKKMPWQYSHDDIDKYIDRPHNEDQLVSSKLLRTTKAATNVVEETSVNSNVAVRIKLLKAGLLKNRVVGRSREGFEYETELEYDGGYYIMKDGQSISYRDALNQCWADPPTNDLQLKVFLDVTSDPNSLWTKIRMFRDYPLEVMQHMKSSSGSSKHEYR